MILKKLLIAISYLNVKFLKVKLVLRTINVGLTMYVIKESVEEMRMPSVKISKTVKVE